MKSLFLCLLLTTSAAYISAQEQNERVTPRERRDGLRFHTLEEPQEQHRREPSDLEERTGSQQQRSLDSMLRDRPPRMTESERMQQDPRFFENRRSYYARQRRAAHLIQPRFIHRHPDHRLWFGPEFYRRHHIQPYYYQRDINLWRRPEWSYVNLWINTTWNHPIYYDYGYVPIKVYEVEKPEPSYTFSSAGDWLPLGVFALAESESLAEDSAMIFQLAINKSGFIAGTYYNSESDTTNHVEGSISKETQEATWKISENPNSPVMRTGLYNLTQNVTPVSIRFSDGSTQTWLLVRLEQ